jgi:plastocyanin domain-containing protein
MPSMSWMALAAALACGRQEAPRSGPIPVTADEKGFTPSAVTVAKGSPASLVFTRTSDKTCADKVVFPEIGVTKDLPLNKPVSVDVPTEAARTLTFQCGMGMFKSSVVVK